MGTDYIFDNTHHDIALCVADKRRYRDVIDSVHFEIIDDGTPLTRMTIRGSFEVLLTAINDEFGDMFNIIAVRTHDGSGKPLSRPSLVGRESGSIKDLERDLGSLIDKIMMMD